MFKFIHVEQWLLFFQNPIFLAAISSWFVSQLIKTILALLGTSIKSLRDFFEIIFWRTGGMPSSHSALVASLCTSIGMKNGFHSDLFIFSVFFAIVVVRDAVGVRRSSGLQAKTLNDLGSKLSESNLTDDFQPLKEIRGHRPVEAVAGIILGIITAILVVNFG